MGAAPLRGRLTAALAAALMLATVTPGGAQLQRVRAVLTPISGADGVVAGSELRLALRISLPVGFHVNSNKLRRRA
jgi:hypothetical protein